MSTEPLSPAARRLLEKDAPITFEEALAACPWQSILGRGRTAEEMMRRLGATVAIVDQKRAPLSADMLADAVATLARGETVLIAAARRSDRDFAKAQILAMVGERGRA